MELPKVFYERITDPDIGFVCVGASIESAEGHGVTGARILPRDDGGYILEAAHPGEGPYAHFLTAGGSRLGDPPLDAPSDPIYRFCEAVTGIDEPEKHVGVELLVDFDETLRESRGLTVLTEGACP